MDVKEHFYENLLNDSVMATKNVLCGKFAKPVTNKYMLIQIGYMLVLLFIQYMKYIVHGAYALTEKMDITLIRFFCENLSSNIRTLE